MIAELFLDGNPIFSFSQLLSYIKGEYNPESLINRINDPSVQELVKHMIQKDPTKRFSAQKYLSMWYVHKYTNLIEQDWYNLPTLL